EKPAGEYRLADRPGEKERGRIHRLAAAELGDAISFREHDAEVVDYRDAHRRHVVRTHAVEQLERNVRLFGDLHAVPQVMLDCGRVLRAGSQGKKDGGSDEPARSHREIRVNGSSNGGLPTGDRQPARDEVAFESTRR